MSLIPEETAPGAGFYQQRVQELQRPHPDYVKVQALATLSLVETLQALACQVGEVAHRLDRVSSLSGQAERRLGACQVSRLGAMRCAQINPVMYAILLS